MLRFGDDFALDSRAYELRRAGVPLRLERIPMAILLLLAEHRGQLVSREQIVERVWGKGVHLDTDNSINGAIRKIRQVLGDDSEQPRYIQTVTGLGYRFIASVTDAAEAGPQPRRRTWLAPAIALSLLLVAAITVSLVWSRSGAPQPPAERVMVAVLPFENLTGDPGQEYFSDGLTEEMIAQLGNRDPARLGVIARTSVMRYKDGRPSVERVGRELGVQYVLEGSVRRDANAVRVTAQLIGVRDQAHLWARQYDRALTDLLTLQGEIAQDIADEIQFHLGDPKPPPSDPLARSTADYEAYDLYLKGQHFFNRRTVPGLEAAVGYFERATARDSGFSRAHAALAMAYALLAGYRQRPPGPLVSQAREAARKAIELDPRSPEAQTAFALVVQNHDWDWPAAERGFRRAIELNPSYATAHHWYAEHLMWRGRFDEALRESERARQLDPLSLIIATDHAVILLHARQYDRAIQQFRAVLDVDPDFPRALQIGAAYFAKGEYATALADLERQRPKMPAWAYWFDLTCQYGRSGQAAKAREALRQMLHYTRGDPPDAVMMGSAFACVGDTEQAITWLEQAYAERANGLTSLKVNGVFDPLRDDPRFQSLLRRVGLAP